MGVKTRVVKCYDEKGLLSSDDKCRSPKPATHDACRVKFCGKWVIRQLGPVSEVKIKY